MKFFLVFTFVALASAVSAQIETRFVDLRVDHFNVLDRRTFDNRYFVNSQHYEPGGPVFIYVIGDDYSEHMELLESGAVFEIARDSRGIIFSLEHRYYGESRPVENTSFENLQWLTIPQTIADLAQFINFIKANYAGTENSAVILWGRKYAGVLATWTRQKYPHLVTGVWASSAGLDATLEMPQFVVSTFETINSIGGTECGDILTGAFKMIEDGIRLRDTAFIEERLRLCYPIDVDIEEDITRLYYRFIAEMGFNFMSNVRYPEIEEKCNIMRGLDSDPPINDLDAFARWWADDYYSHAECLNYNNIANIATQKEIEWDSISTIGGRRQAFWRMCIELGQWPTANEGEGHPFGWRFDLNFCRQWCADVFDQDYFSSNEVLAERIGETNGYFGGLNPNVYRVFFTNGELDPHRHISPSHDLNPLSPAVVMPLQSRGRDFGSPNDTDYAVLQETKARARELILQWIVDHGQENPPPAPDTTAEPPIPAEF